MYGSDTQVAEAMTDCGAEINAGNASIFINETQVASDKDGYTPLHMLQVFA